MARVTTFGTNPRKERAHPHVDLAAMDRADDRAMILRFGGPLRTARARHKKYLKLLDAYMARHRDARLTDELAIALERMAGAKPERPNPPRRGRAGRYVATEMRALRRGSKRVRTRKQAVAVGLSMARRAGVKVPRTNPPALKVAGVLSKKALEIYYVHATDGEKYVHKFEPGVSIQFLSDGSARFYRPDGRPLWKNFR